jgi:hypothetical protein
VSAARFFKLKGQNPIAPKLFPSGRRKIDALECFRNFRIVTQRLEEKLAWAGPEEEARLEIASHVFAQARMKGLVLPGAMKVPWQELACISFLDDIPRPERASQRQ